VRAARDGVPQPMAREAREREAVPPAASRRRGHLGRGRRARSLRSSGKTQHDRAGHARHEGPALPFGEREPGAQLRAGLSTTSTSAEAQPGIRLNPLPSLGSLPAPGRSCSTTARRSPSAVSTTASPDPRVVRRGHSSFPPARGLQYCIRGRHRPRARSLCARSACGPENRGRLGRGVERVLA
jgi:hypothetical protein